MTTAVESTVRNAVLGEELRRLRDAAGLTLNQAAEKIGISYSHLSRMETGKRQAGVADVASLLAVYGVIGQERRDLLELTKHVDQPGWLQNHTRSFAARVSACEYSNRGRPLSSASRPLSSRVCCRPCRMPRQCSARSQ